MVQLFRCANPVKRIQRGLIFVKCRTLSRRMLFLLVLLCTLVLMPAAQAEPEIRPMDVDRVSLYPIPGIRYNKLPTVDGKLEVAFDCENSDWAQALGCVGSANHLNACFKVDTPSDERIMYRVEARGNFRSDSEILAELARVIQEEDWWVYDLSSYFTGYDFIFGDAVYTEKEQKLSFREATDTMLILGWYDKDMNLLFAEKADVAVTFSSVKTRTVQADQVSPERVLANADRLIGVESTLKSGRLTYRLYNEAAQNPSDKRSIRTEIRLPEGTAKVLEVDYFGNQTEHTVDGPVLNVWTGLIRHDGKVFDGIYSEHSSFVFMDENGQVLDGSGRLSIVRINEDSNKLSLAYLEGDSWRPFTNENLKSDFGDANHLLTTDLKDGRVHISAKEGIAITDEDARTLADITKRYIIKVPNNAKSYRVNQMGGPNMFGSLNAENDRWMLENDIPFGALTQITGDTIEPFNRNLFWEASTSDNGISLYRTASETLEGRATLFAVEWFSDTNGEQLMYTEWFGETAEELVLKPSTVRYEDEEQMANHKGTPAYADLNGSGYKLYAEFRPQSGNNGFVIMLELRDKNDHLVTHIEKNDFEFFIPYPVGNAQERDYKYSLTHYFDSEMTSSEPVTEMVCEEHGIRFKVSSLSPFELTWEQTAPVATPTPIPAPPANLPKTGDSTPVALLLVLLLGASAVIMAACRRRSIP